MTVWKLTIKPDAAPGRDAFAWCRARGLVGVGWSHVYPEPESGPKKTLDEFQRFSDGGALPPAVRTLAHDVQVGDFVWLHRHGRFYLCRISSAHLLVGLEIGPEFRAHDVGHAREAAWVEVPSECVPGNVERALIVSRMIQRIRCSTVFVAYFEHLHRQLDSDPGWRPELGDDDVRALIRSTSLEDLAALLCPDDWEDVLAGYLQSLGWTLVKSSCFRSKPKYEFRMLRSAPHREIGLVQAKSGAVTLQPTEYAADAAGGAKIFLFAVAGIRTEGCLPSGVSVVSIEALIEWMAGHPALLTDDVRLRLSLSQHNSFHAKERTTQ